MLTLKFGPINKNVGFTPLNAASFSDMPPAKIVRELTQNALDAAAEAEQETVRVRFQVDEIAQSDIPDIKGYQSAFKKAVQFQNNINGGSLSDAAQQVVSQIEDGLNDLSKGKARMLSVMDNAIGLDAKRMISLLGDGASAKSENLSGSYGVGHLAPMALSDIQYMLYGGVTKSGKRIVCGQTVLATHYGEGALNAPEGFLVNGFGDGLNGNLYNFLRKAQHPTIIAERLDGIREEWGHGSVIGIPAFNNFRQRQWSLWDVVSKVVAYNFCSAVHQGGLSIEVCEGDSKETLNKETLKEVLERDKERSRATRADSFFEGLRPSGQNAYSIWETLAEGNRESIKLKHGKAHISLLTPTENGNTRVDLFRNGMWITDNIPGMKSADFASHQPFHAVIEVESPDGGELHRLIRKAEGPMHNEISLGRLSRTERKKLRQTLKAITEWVKERAPEIEGEEYPVDDYLRVESDDDATGGNRNYSFWGKPTAVRQRRVSQVIDVIELNPVDDPPRPPGPGPGPRPAPRPGPRPSPNRRKVNPLPFRSVVVPVGAGTLKGTLRCERDFDETLLVIQVDENMDSTCDRVWKDEEVAIASFNIKPITGVKEVPQWELLGDGKYVRICNIEKSTDYELEIEYEAPDEIVGAVTTPVFRMQLHRATQVTT